MKKIIISLPCLNRGGTELQTLNLVRALVDEGYAIITLCYFEYNPEVVREFQNAGSTVELLCQSRSIPWWKFIHLLRIKFKQYKPEIVHIQYMTPGALPILAARLAGVKRVYATVHQPWTPKYHGLRSKILLRLSARLVFQFITVSENAEKTWFGSSHLFDPEHIPDKKSRHITIHNAINLEEIDKITHLVDNDKARAKLGLQNTYVIGAISRLSYEKGIDLLIYACSKLFSSNRQLRLLLVGDGHDKPKLQKMSDDLGLTDQIIFTGSKTWEESIKLLNLMDVVVCPSRFEGFGLTAAEAMACSKPVVANNTGGLSEVVTDQVNGLLTNAEDPVQLADSIRMLINNPLLSQEYGKCGRENVENRFTKTILASKICHLYKMNPGC